MQDRVPLYPGRVKLTPVSGQENTYDMVRADEPTQKGDPLSKDTFLKDATAALYGLGADAVPDDVLSRLSRFNSGLCNEYVWDKSQTVTVPTQTTIPASTPFAQCYSAQGTYYIRYSSSYEVVDGKFVLTNYSQITANSNSDVSVFDALKGAYFATPSTSSSFINSLDSIFLMPSDTTITRESGYSGMSGAAYFSSVGLLKISDVHDELQHVAYLNSPDTSAYPPAVSDGYTYTALGKLGAKVQMATGSYTGTGTYGVSNPCSLTFEFAPKIVIIRSDSGGYNMVLTCNSAKAIGDSQSTWGSNNVTWADGGKSVSWYVVSGGGVLGSVVIDADMQCNAADDTYTYIAIA